jgi:hypothetical protein
LKQRQKILENWTLLLTDYNLPSERKDPPNSLHSMKGGIDILSAFWQKNTRAVI